MWPAYVILAVLPGAYVGVTTRSPGAVLFSVASFWLLGTLGFAVSIDAPKASWRLAGPAKWTHDRPLVSGAAAAVALTAPLIAVGAIVWRATLVGAAYGTILALSGLLLRRRRSSGVGAAGRVEPGGRTARHARDYRRWMADHPYGLALVSGVSSFLLVLTGGSLNDAGLAASVMAVVGGLFGFIARDIAGSDAASSSNEDAGELGGEDP